MNDRMPVTTTHHLAIDIAATPEAVWAEILSEYVEARKFRELGKIEPIDNPSAPLGSYRLHLKHEGGVIDERVVCLTERDEARYRLSLVADYLSDPGGLRVYATYHAQQSPGGARFVLDCHASREIEIPGREIEIPAGASRADILDIIAKDRSDADDGMMSYLNSVRMKLENNV